QIQGADVPGARGSLRRVKDVTESKVKWFAVDNKVTDIGRSCTRVHIGGRQCEPVCDVLPGSCPDGVDIPDSGKIRRYQHGEVVGLRTIDHPFFKSQAHVSRTDDPPVA